MVKALRPALASRARGLRAVRPSSDTAATLTRRSLLANGAAAGLAALGGRPAAAAATRPVPFGGAIMSDHFDADRPYVQAFLDHCDIILPMNELKFEGLRPERGTFNFAPADRLLAFAAGHGRASRGHAFVWWNALPAWLTAIADPAEAERVLVTHIETVMDRYRGRVASWDVVNEVIAHEPVGGAPLRDSYWLRTLGARHIPVAFRAAAAADPAARLVLNDYSLEFAGPEFDARRAVALSLVRQLQDAAIRVDAVGIQGHLYADWRIDQPALYAFGETLRRMGVGLLVTELDVIDWKVEGGPDEQDAAAGRIVESFLDAAFAAQRPEAVCCWGITDRYSWIPEVMPRPDGSPSRPLPLDADLRPKAWLEPLRRRLARA